MLRTDFDYDLPAELIAQRPLAARSAARLLALDGMGGLADRAVRDLVELVRPGDLLVMNDTRVVPARLYAHKETGGRVEILIERITAPTQAMVHLRASKSPQPGSRLHLAGGVAIQVLGKTPLGLYAIETCDGVLLTRVLEAHGHVPLPPYITRADDAEDRERYQTVFARRPGAVAAPTAGLHFDEALLAAVTARGVSQAFVTLHVGAGTFQPVRVAQIEAHEMHAEWLEVSPETVAHVEATRRRGGRVIAVGTTAVRALETAASNGTLAPYTGDTRLFIYPGYNFRVVDCLLTNFHLPQSTLLMLVATFGGFSAVMAAYRHAVAAGYRFFSYGDAMWLTAAPAGRDTHPPD